KGGVLVPQDVAGVVQQENYNEISGVPTDPVALVDAAGNASPVTLSIVAGAGTSSTGTGLDTADHALLQGYIHNNNTASLDVTLAGVPPGNYALILYTMGFNFNTKYDQTANLVGAQAYPPIAYTAQHAGQYNGAYVRAVAGTGETRALGNYVEFEGIGPAVDGTLTLSITSEATDLLGTGAPGLTVAPALNGFELIKIVPVVKPPKLGVPTTDAGGVSFAWTGGTGPFKVQFKSHLTDAWGDLATTPNKTYTAPATAAAGFFRVVDTGN
ncbi:MAG TPA: hypothetical protein VMF06_25340, partial [Candidatus Limnocylindria bacterium]|nr:hypothetical protein [Candidatus Limnocylindria bacterium]